jgi:hypothetical protein
MRLGHWISSNLRRFIEGGLFALVAGAALGIWFSDGDPVTIIGAVIFGAVFAILGVLTAPHLTRGRRVLWAAIAIATLVLDGGFVYWHKHKPTAVRSVPSHPAPAAVFYAQCFMTWGPVADTGRVNLLELGGGLERLPSLGLEHLGSLIPRKPLSITISKTQSFYRCEITNYAPTSLFDVTIGIQIMTQEAIRAGKPNSHALRSGKTLTNSMHTLTIPKIDAGSGNSFSFYVTNTNERQFISFAFGRQVSARPLGQSSAHTFGLLSPAPYWYQGLGLPTR